MRILLAGPDHPHGSLPPYLQVLADGLRRLGAHVDRLGSAVAAYDARLGRFRPAEQITAAADTLAGQLDPADYDLISLHFGNLEIEQLLPDRWRRRGARLPPVAIHVHALDWTLFTRHVPHRSLRAAVDAGVTTAAGLVCFGQHAQTALTRRLPNTAAQPTAVIPLPTTIPPGTPAAASPRLAAAMHNPRQDATLLTLYGYAAPWKSPADLLAALATTSTPLRVVIAGPFWDDPDQAGCDLRAAVDHPLPVGPAQLVVVPAYLDAPQRAALTAGSAAGLFPYRPHDTFQGSGAIADYLAHGIPVVATDVANMAELIGPAGIVVPADNPTELGCALDRLAADRRQHAVLAAAARAQADRFTAAEHAAACMAFYHRLAARQADSRPP
jgi:glycosyltransferase involved in cell wall biosynthesis